MIYDSQGFRVIVSERDGLTKITAYNEGSLGGRSRGVDGIVTGGLKMEASPEDVIAVYGKPDSPPGTDETVPNGGLLYREPHVDFGFFDFQLVTVEMSDIDYNKVITIGPRR